MSLYTAALKQLLVASDLSNQADHALARALQLAADHGAELDIVHVMEEGLPPEAQAELREDGEAAIRERLAASPLARDVKVTIDLIVGRPDTDIVERSVMTNADCIVLGRHERLLAENRAIEGTLAETVIGTGKRPVLLVQNEPRGSYRSVIVGIDTSPLSEAAIRAAVMIAPKAALHLVHAYSEKALSENNTPIDVERAITGFVAKQKDIFRRAAERAGLPELSVRSVIAEGDPREVLKFKVAKREADLLVLGTHGRTGISRALLGSVTTDMINERLCDVLVIRPE